MSADSSYREKALAPRGIPAIMTKIFLVIVALSTLYPFIFLTSTALKSRDEYASNVLGPPEHLTTANFDYVWNELGVGLYVQNTAIVVLASVALILGVACPAGFALARFRFPLRQALLITLVSAMMIPVAVILIPEFQQVVNLGLLDKRVGLVLVYTSLNTPFAVFLMTAFFRGVDNNIVEAAYLDGASVLRTFLSIVVPLVRSGILTLATLTFISLWNEFLLSLLLLPSESQRTLTVGLAKLTSQYKIDITLLAAGLMVAALPPLIAFIVFQRFIVSGLSEGATK